jgi:hypothetical protein
LDVQGFLSIIPTDTPPEFKDAVIGTHHSPTAHIGSSSSQA